MRAGDAGEGKRRLARAHALEMNRPGRRRRRVWGDLAPCPADSVPAVPRAGNQESRSSTNGAPTSAGMGGDGPAGVGPVAGCCGSFAARRRRGLESLTPLGRPRGRLDPAAAAAAAGSAHARSWRLPAHAASCRLGCPVWYPAAWARAKAAAATAGPG